jgi:hypothetical protein
MKQTQDTEHAQICEAMASVGFSPQHTGGGCMAYQRDVPDGEILITISEDAMLPDHWDEAILVGRYCFEHGEAIEEEEYESVCAFFAAVAKGDTVATR